PFLPVSPLGLPACTGVGQMRFARREDSRQEMEEPRDWIIRTLVPGLVAADFKKSTSCSVTVRVCLGIGKSTGVYCEVKEEIEASGELPEVFRRSAMS
ncbi:MAG: hypothetical protein V3V11_04080, partial [Vicinamibacteria bacterium]